MAVRTEQKAGFGYALTCGFDAPREDGSFEWAADARMRFQSRRMRHDDHGFNPDGILEDMRFTIDVLVRHEPAPGLSLGAYVGVEAWQMYEVEDKRGHKIDRFNTYAKPVIGLDLSWKF